MRRTLIALIVMAVAVSARAGDAERDLMRSWKHRMLETENALKSGDYERAKKLADGTVGEMAERLGPGEGSTRLFTTALTHKALALAAAGEAEEAIWYWQVVLGLDPGAAGLDLSPFGDAARLLEENRGRRPLETVAPDAGTIDPPKVTRKRKPKFPHGAHYFGVSGDLVVEVVVTADGRVRDPQIVAPLPAATLSYAALEAVKRWKFDPARAAGQPIDMIFNLTVAWRN